MQSLRNLVGLDAAEPAEAAISTETSQGDTQVNAAHNTPEAPSSDGAASPEHASALISAQNPEEGATTATTRKVASRAKGLGDITLRVTRAGAPRPAGSAAPGPARLLRRTPRARTRAHLGAESARWLTQSTGSRESATTTARRRPNENAFRQVVQGYFLQLDYLR